MLIASLPHLPPHFDVEQPPIKRSLLVERLRMLHPADAHVVNQAIAFLAWDRQPLDRTDQDVIATYQRLMASISSTVLREVIQVRMNYRTIIAALRRRRAGQSCARRGGTVGRTHSPPFPASDVPPPGPLSVDRAVRSVACRCGSHAAQYLLFDNNYRYWRRRSEQYTFCFEALVLYLVRWEIIDRWTSRNAAAGQERFEKLITEILGDYARLF